MSNTSRGNHGNITNNSGIDKIRVIKHEHGKLGNPMEVLWERKVYTMVGFPGSHA
jgi:hypothetical protein